MDFRICQVNIKHINKRGFVRVSYRGVVQSVEQLSPKQFVESSSLSAPAKGNSLFSSPYSVAPEREC